jgi:uncharacterized membrane protein YhaH (DUF805 family)
MVLPTAMSELLNRFSFVTARITGEIAVFLLLIWLIILACAISSIRAQPWSDAQRRFWMVVVALVPIAGLLAYLPFSFRREDLPNHFMLRNKDGKRHGAPRRTSQTSPHRA